MKFINPYRLFHGTWIPEWLDSRPEISDGAKRLYARLCCFAGNKGEAFPSYRKLAEKLQKSRRQTICIMEELCYYNLITVTHVRDEVRGNRANIYRFLWHPWMQLAEDKNYSLVKVDFARPPSDINVTSPGDTRVTSPSVKNVTQKRIIYEERGREERIQTLFCTQSPPPQKVFERKSNDIQNADPWKRAEEGIENFKQQKLCSRERENIVSDISKLNLCAKSKEALALKWFIKAAKAASLGLSSPSRQQTLSIQAVAISIQPPKLQKPASNSQTEEKRLAIAKALQIFDKIDSPTEFKNHANHKRDQGLVNRFAQSALCLRSCVRLLAKCSFAWVEAIFEQPFKSLAWLLEKDRFAPAKPPFDMRLGNPSTHFSQNHLPHGICHGL